MKALAFGASSSGDSINKAFASFAVREFSSIEDMLIEVIDLRDYQMPIFSTDIQENEGIPSKARDFFEKIYEADLLVISLAEHNGAYTAAFKNILDWASVIDMNLFSQSKMFLLSTSPGVRGGSSVMNIALGRFPFMGARIEGHFSLPEYYKNFSPSQGILNPSLKESFLVEVEKVKRSLEK